MRVRIVTGYVPLPDNPRPPAEYGALGERLGGVPVPKRAFYQRLEETWMYQFLRTYPLIPYVSAGDNPAKNTLAYHCVQHQKTEWLRASLEHCPDTDVFVWVDYGIFHQPGVCNEAIVRFCESLDDKAIYAPGCWEQHSPVGSDSPCWRFCGSVLAVPRHKVEALHYACVRRAVKHIRACNNVDWEVNTWARVELKEKLPWHWYKADHDVSQFWNVPTLKRSTPDAVS